jgi:uncharacterized lipoprotein
MPRLKIAISCYLLVSGLYGCSTVNKALPDYRHDYKTSTTERSLKIPPDLISFTRIKERLVVPEMVSSDKSTPNQITEVLEPPNIVLPK